MRRKRLLSWVLTFAMIAGMFVVPARAEGGTTTITQDTEGQKGTMTITLVIPKKTPAATDFTYTAPSDLTYSGSDKAATVAAKDGVTGMGAVTVKYYSDATRTTEATPTNVGTYYVGITVVEGDNYTASTGVLYDADWTFSITASTPDAPAAPTKASATKNSITLNTVSGCEYSKDGENWQDSPTFSDLTPSTEYTFYQRVKATANTNASAASTGASFNTEADTYAMTITLVIGAVMSKSLTYNGEAQELVKDETAADVTPTYAIGANATTAPASEYSAAIPKGTNAGSYYVWYKENGGDAKCVTATIAPKSVTVSGIKAKDKTYSGTTAATLDYSDVVIDGKLSADTLTVTATGTFADANVGAGKTVTISGISLGGASKDNYTLAAEGQQTTTTASITPATMQVTVLDYAGAYDGNAHGISVLVLSPAGASVTYSTTENGTYTNTPIQRMDAGTTTVYYKVSKDGNYDEVEGSGTITVNKRDISNAVITFTTSDVAPYTGSSVSAPEYSVTLDGSALASSAYDVSGNSGTSVGAYTLTLTGKGNYTGTATKTWKIATNPVTISAMPTAGAITYGQALSASTLTGGTASVAGTFAWADGTIVPDSAGTKTYDVVFTPSDSSYASVTKSVTLTVNKATPQITTNPTASAITAGKTLGDSKLSGGVATAQYGTARVVGKFAWQEATSTVIDAAGTPEKTVTFTPLDTNNYNDTTTTVTLTVGKTAPTGLSITPSSATYAFASEGAIPSFAGSGTHSDSVAPVIYYSTRNFTVNDINSTDVKAWSTVATTSALPVGDYYVAAYYAAGANTSAYLTAPAILTVTKGTRVAPSAVANVDVENMTATLNSADRNKSLEYKVDSGAWTLVSANASGVFKLPALSAASHNIYLRERGNANYETTAASDAKNFTLAKVSVSYNANGGINAPTIQTVTSGSTVEIADAGTMKRAGYTFTGWKTAANGSGTSYAAGATPTVDSSMVLYAQWSATSYKVKYHSNYDTDETKESSSITYDTSAQLDANTFTRAGYSFAGWAESASGSVIYSDKQAVKNLSADGSTVDLYAVWTENTYSVICDISTEYTSPVTLTMKRGNTVFAALNGLTVTNGKAEASFSGVPSGLYNLVASQTESGRDIVMTVAVVVTNSDVPQSIEMPSGNTNSTLTVAEDSRPVVVDGLAKEAEDKAQVSDGVTTTTVTVAMEVSKQEEQELTDSADEKQKDTQAAIEDIKAEAAKTAGSGDQTLEFMNIDVSKTVTTESSGGGDTSTETTPITETSNVIELVIPFDMTGKAPDGLKLYRHHDGTTTPLTKDNNRTDGHFHWLAGFIHLFTNKFSTYAIGYTEGTFYTITLDATTNGGTISPTTATTGADGKLLSLPTPSKAGSYSFNGWYTASSGGTKVTTSTVFGSDTTIYAQWTYTGGTSTSNSSSGSNATTVPVSGDSASVSVSASVSGTTATVKAPTTAELNKVIGASVKTGEVTIDVSGLKKDITTVSIPTTTITAIEKAVADPSNDADALTVKLTDGSVTFDAKALAAIIEQAKGSDIKLNLDSVGESKLNSAQRTAIQSADVQAAYDVYMTSNGTRISDFDGGHATVSVTYALKSGQVASGVVVWYVASDGALTEIPTTYTNRAVSFTVEHFSNYVVAYDKTRAVKCPQDASCPISAFTDTDAMAWYHDGVHWVLENNVMNGVGDGKFNPNGDTSRAMVATMLWRMEGSPVVNYAMSFTDVGSNLWYTEGIRWANSAGIITGYTQDGGKVFNPDGAVTREQLAAMLYRYAQYKGMDVSVGEDTNILSYGDAFSVSDWAMPAMQWACGAGIVSGYSEDAGRILAPQRASSRAVVATMFVRLRFWTGNK